MKIIVLGETEIAVTPEEVGTAVEEPAGVHFGPLHMLAASLGVCTLGVLHTWAGTAHLPVGGLVVTVRWTYEERPHRVGSFAVEVRWPSLPESRRPRARRVAAACIVHRTLEAPPVVEVGFEE